jgi:hypothetical protein
VARYASYYSSTGGRTLTLTGLDSTKLYRLDFYATRGYVPSQNTIFAANGSSVTVATNNNTATIGTLDNLVPASGGRLVITITHSATYDYVNGFTITEKTPVAPAAKDSTELTGLSAAITPDSTSILSQELAVYPNPTKGIFELHVNNANTGRMKVDVLNSGGMLVKEFILAKTTTVFETQLSLVELRSGNYFIVTTIGSWRQTVKLVKY